MRLAAGGGGGEPCAGPAGDDELLGGGLGQSQEGQEGHKELVLQEGNRDIVGIGFLGRRMGAGGWGFIPS